MAAVRPRLSVVLDEEVHETVRRVAAVQGRSMSRVVAEMVTELEPGLRQVADLGEALGRMSDLQKDDWRRAIAAADTEVAGPLAEAVEGYQKALANLQKVALGAAADTGTYPPQVTRG